MNESLIALRDAYRLLSLCMDDDSTAETYAEEWAELEPRIRSLLTFYEEVAL